MKQKAARQAVALDDEGIGNKAIKLESSETDQVLSLTLNNNNSEGSNLELENESKQRAIKEEQTKVSLDPIPLRGANREIIDISSSPPPQQLIYAEPIKAVLRPSPPRVIKREIIELSPTPSPLPKKAKIAEVTVKVEAPEATASAHKTDIIAKLEKEEKEILKEIEEAERLVELRKKRDDIQGKLKAARGH